MEINILFNDAHILFTVIWCRVKDNLDSERGNPQPPLHGLLSSISSKVGFSYMHHPIERIAHTTVFVNPVVVQWMEQEISQ